MTKKIILIIGILLLLNVGGLVFVSNFNAGFIIQGVIAVLLIVYALVFKRVPRFAHIVIGVICALPLLLIAFLAIYGNINNATYNEDVVIVLGAAIHGEQVSAPLASRLDEAIAYYERNPNATFIVCGGQGMQEDISEALAMKRYLAARGIPEAQILEEEKSTSTYENFKFAKPILDERFPNGYKTVIITSDFHVYRAVQTAKRFGINATHIGAPIAWYNWPMAYLREVAAVGRMWVMPQR